MLLNDFKAIYYVTLGYASCVNLKSSLKSSFEINIINGDTQPQRSKRVIKVDSNY